jgi:hypothetical protein
MLHYLDLLYEPRGSLCRLTLITTPFALKFIFETLSLYTSTAIARRHRIEFLTCPVSSIAEARSNSLARVSSMIMVR